MAHVSAKNSYTCVACDSRFALRHPRDFTLPTSRRGALYPKYIYYHWRINHGNVVTQCLLETHERARLNVMLLLDLIQV